MAKYLTPDQYRTKVRGMDTSELEVLMETFTINWDSLTKEEMACARIINMEIERRILAWEVTEV